MELKSQVALVTGAARGLGLQIAEDLAREGVNVCGTDIRMDLLEANLNRISTEHQVETLAIEADVSVASDVKMMVGKVFEKWGELNILVNNAGITRDNLLMRMKEDEWGDIMNTNLTSVFRMSKACMRGMMKARNGRIISIASVVGATGNPGQANYAAAKAGIIGFSKSLAREIGSRGVTVNVVAPGFIDTDMTKALPDEQRQALITQIPTGCLGAPEDIASAVAFLASAGARYINGETIHVNGGMYMS